VPVDFERAAHYFRLAAKGDNANAMANLGLCYRDGKGVARSLDDARKWLLRAKKAGFKDPAAIDAFLADINARVAESGAALTATLAAREAQRLANLAELVAAEDAAKAAKAALAAAEAAARAGANAGREAKAARARAAAAGGEGAAPAVPAPPAPPAAPAAPAAPPAALLPCAECKASKPAALFTGSQLKKEALRRCRACVDAAK